MENLPQTVLLTFDVRQSIPNSDARLIDLPGARYRKRSGSSTVYAIECPIDHGRLTDRAKALLASGWRGTFMSGDELVDTPLKKHRSVCSITDAVDPLLQYAGIDPNSPRAEKVRRTAAGIAACYGAHAAAKVERFDIYIGAAPISAIDDATDYVNGLAAGSGIFALGDSPVDVGAAPWSLALLGREISENEWIRFSNR